MKVALLTPYDGGNLGDAAIQEALIGNFRIYDPQVHLCGITLHPESYRRAPRHSMSSIGGDLASVLPRDRRNPQLPPTITLQHRTSEEAPRRQDLLGVSSERSAVSSFG